MKTAIVFADGIKQIILTPENKDEKQALSYITPQDDIELAVKKGSFGNKYMEPFAVNVQRCQGQYLRVYDDSESVMLVLSPRKEEKIVVQEQKIINRTMVVPTNIEIGQAAIDHANGRTDSSNVTSSSFRAGAFWMRQMLIPNE